MSQDVEGTAHSRAPVKDSEWSCLTLWVHHYLPLSCAHARHFAGLTSFVRYDLGTLAQGPRRTATCLTESAGGRAILRVALS